MIDSEFCVLLWTAPSETEGYRIARLLLEKRYVACAHILPLGHSLYWWEGEITAGQEQQVLLKTVSAHAEKVFALIREVGSYENPELLGLPVNCQAAPYADWIRDSVRVSNAN